MLASLVKFDPAHDEILESVPAVGVEEAGEGAGRGGADHPHRGRAVRPPAQHAHCREHSATDQVISPTDKQTTPHDCLTGEAGAAERRRNRFENTAAWGRYCC